MTPLEEASDPTTRPERLHELASSTLEIGRVVAANPNASAETLLLLGDRFHVEVLANPVFELMLFDDRSLLFRNERFCDCLGRSPDTPPWMLEAMIDRAHASPKEAWGLLVPIGDNQSLSRYLVDRLTLVEEHRVFLADSAVSWPVLWRLMSDVSPWVRDRAKRRAPKSFRGWASLLQRAERLAAGQDAKGARRERAYGGLGRGQSEGDHRRGERGPRGRKRGREELSVEDQRLLSEGGVWARVLLARQERIAPELARVLALDEAPQVRRAVAESSWLDDAVIDLLMSREEEATSRRLVDRPRLSESLAKALARSGFPSVRRRLMVRLDLPLAALLLLEGDAAFALERRACRAEPRRKLRQPSGARAAGPDILPGRPAGLWSARAGCKGGGYRASTRPGFWLPAPPGCNEL